MRAMIPSFKSMFLFKCQVRLDTVSFYVAQNMGSPNILFFKFVFLWLSDTMFFVGQNLISQETK